jgi:hypothetical protein
MATTVNMCAIEYPINDSCKIEKRRPIRSLLLEIYPKKVPADVNPKPVIMGNTAEHSRSAVFCLHCLADLRLSRLASCKSKGFIVVLRHCNIGRPAIDSGYTWRQSVERIQTAIVILTMQTEDG